MTRSGETQASTKPGFLCVLWVGLSLSIGWGIRGNFGHEYGAMIPGALASLAAVLLSGRSDWHRRGVFFAFFGALGWSFGGSILPKTIAVGVVAMALAVLADWGVTRAIYGDRQAPHASRHIRFGPDATATTAKPKPGVPHP